MNTRPTVFPLNHDQPSPDIRQNADQLTERYKNMLGSQAAGTNVGLFYQLEKSALENVELDKVGTSGEISRYGMNGGVIESGGVLA